uniref:PKD domain-containing protein n=1 Tax=Mesonia mobilis TaxID=369791 RepID=UPI0026F07513
MKNFYFFLFFTIISIYSYSQEYNIGDQEMIETCTGNFYDTGGPNGGTVFPEETVVTTICPDSDLNIQVVFNSFITSATDILYVYDGDSTNAPLIDSYSGPQNTLFTISVADQSPTGCLTFEYVPDGMPSPLQGWNATISCVEACQIITPSITSVSPSTEENGGYTVNVFADVAFNAEAIFENNGDNATFSWDFGDGETANGQSVNHAFTDLEIYNVELTVTDENGCISTISFPVEVVFYEDDGDCVITTVNYDFEEPTVPSIATFLNDSNVPGWFTTATDSQMEFWVSTNGSGGIPAYSGNQYIELNANQSSGVYQDYDTAIEGTQFYFSFAHAARNQAPSGQDVVGVYAGSPGANLTLVAQYSTAINAGWDVKVGTYTVPANQPVTRFEFRAISTASGDNTVGNFLDAIQFTANLGILTQPQTIACTNEVVLEAMGSGQWIAEPNNPSTVDIENPNSNTTTVTGLDNFGVYTFTWTNQYCEESVTVEVTEGNFSLNTTSLDILGNCDDDGINSEVYDLTQTETSFIDDPETLEISYYENEDDASLGNSNTINDPENYTFINDTPYTIFVRIEDESCFVITEINAEIFTSPEVQEVQELSNCFESLGDASYNLEDNNTLILGDQDISLFNISYHSSQTNADDNIDPLDLNYQPSEVSETIYARIENANNTNCYSTETFEIITYTVSAATPSDIEACDDDNDGETIFDLTVNEAETLDAQNPNNFTVTYYTSQVEADNGNPAEAISTPSN